MKISLNHYHYSMPVSFDTRRSSRDSSSEKISTTTKDYLINTQDLNGVGMTSGLILSTIIAISSVALGKPIASSMAILGDVSIGGTIIRVQELANTLQVCLDSGTKKILLPLSSADLGGVPPELMGSFNIVFYDSAEDAVFKALGVE